MSDQRRGGLITLQINGEVNDAKGDFTANLGKPQRTSIVGTDVVHGYTEAPQPGFIEGAVTDRVGLDLEELVTGDELTISMLMANGKMFTLHDAYYVGEGTVNTSEGEIGVRWEGRGEEVKV